MKELIKSFLAFGLATTIEKLIAFLLLPLYAHVFSAEMYGYIDLIQVTIIIISTFSVLQLETSLQRYYYVYSSTIKTAFISTIFFTILICSIFVCFISILAYPILDNFLFKGINIRDTFYLASIQIPFTNIGMLCLLLLRFEKKNILFTFIILTKVIITLIFTVLFLIVYPMGINGVFSAQLISSVVSSFLLIYVVKNHLKLTFSFKLLKKSVKYAFPQLPARIGSALSGNINRYFMVGYLTVASIGIYSFALKMASIMQLFYTAFILAWSPFIFSQLKNPNHKQVFSQSLNIIALPIFFIVIIISLFSKEMIHIIAVEEYYSSQYLVGGLTLYYSLFIIKEIVDIGPRFKEKTYYISISYLITLILNVSLLFFLVPTIGVKGVVIAMIFTNICLVAFSWYFSHRLYPILYNISKFLISGTITFCIVLFSMYTNISLGYRLLLFIIVSILFILFFLKITKEYKQVS